MHAQLIEHIKKTVSLTADEEQAVNLHFSSHTVKKKSLLLEEGQVCNKQYFIVKGCLRSYIINQKGAEQTLQFAIENWWMADYLSFDNQAPSPYFIQAVENAEVLAISRPAFDELLLKLPKLERYFRKMLQKSLGAAQMRINFLFTMNAEERYHNMNTRYPEFVQRVPQYMLASYLDFSPEFLSKIRAGKV